ncbi:LuxR family transcriptional regulator [Agrobacterium sp. NPDC089420]|uniref:LuxR family transcriptional regulator n=1 Tax=Agrobacterium sp. NPDC089420 TaxID=3363918 RepID=UPI00384CE797
MAGSEADKAAILAVIHAETEAWLQRDFEGLRRHWLHSPQTRRMEYYASLGIRIDEGWDAIETRLKNIIERYPEKRAFTDNIRWERVNIVIAGTMAWVTYDQIGIDGGEDLKRELKILHKVEDMWKIGCVVMMESTVEQAECPLIEVDEDARVLWTNRQAQLRIQDHQGLAMATGRIRARRPQADHALCETVRLAHHELKGQTRLSLSPKQAWAVPLGEDEAGAPMHCWVLLEDGRTFVSFEDAETVTRRVNVAREVYGLSAAQIRLAHHIVAGDDLASAAKQMGVSVNTVRTQMQRIFDKTGVRHQAALVRALLSMEARNK